MDKAHKNILNLNFEFLVNNCKSDILLTALRNRIDISSEEYKELDEIKDKKKQCRKLFTFLMTQGPRTFDSIINALVETNQYTVLGRLKPSTANSNYNIATAYNQHIEQQRCNKVFIEPETYYDEANINVVNVTSQDSPLNVVVNLSSNFDYEQMESKLNIPFYNTTSENRGLVKIINIEHVVGKKFREGSAVDVNNLKNLFEQMGFAVDVHDNDKLRPTKTNVLKAVQEFVTDKRLIDADIAMLFIMSHGGHYEDKDYVSDCDNGKIFLKDIERYFYNDKCINMQNKPKMIFVQACRGDFSDYGTRRRVETDSQHMNIDTTNQYMPAQTDILLAHSTCVGFASHRDTVVGTWFIYLLCEVFMTHAHDKDVESMLKIVYEKLKHERTVEGEMQTGETTQRTFKKCYLNPGIYRNKETNKICYF